MVETPISVSDQPYFDLLFDPEWYLTRHPDVRTSGFTAIDHFHAHGLQENRSPHPLFHPQWYLDVNEDVAANGMPAFMHYLAYGIAEGRAPHPLFDPAFYIDRYGLSGTVPPIVQFLESGEAAGHVPTPLFDAAYYLERHADVVASKTLPFAHFIRTGFYRDYVLSRLFDNKWYHRQNDDLDADVSNVEHFLLFGIREERDPSPLFQSSWYRTQYRDRLQDKPVFRHYVENGHLRPNWLFDPGHVARQLTAQPARRELLDPLIFPAAVAANETIVFTSIANNYMPFASVLAESLKRHNKHVRFVIVLCDEMDEGMDIPAGVDEILPVRVLFGDDFSTWAFQHDLVELCTAAKGFALEHFLARPSCTRVIYLDPDVYVTGALSIVQAALDDASILVTPHLLSPETNPDAIEQNEFDALRHGAFNLGFLGVRNDAAGTRFARWWRQRLTHYCVDRREDGLFVDQKWMDLAPGFFPELGILRHPGHNAAPWNLSRRKIEGNLLDGFKVDGQPLVFFHFSGHASGAGDGMLNRYGADMPAASLLSQAYRHRLTLASASGEPRPWSFAYYDNGVPIDAAERALYRKRKDLQARFADPFSTANVENYLHWYRRTGDRNANVAHAHIAPLKSGRTMLERYLIASRTKPVHPNALFDAEFYSEVYSDDVPRDAADAFAHYLHQGLAEGRQPCPSFDPAVYCKEAGFSNPTECLEDVLERGLDPTIRPVATFDPRFDVDVVAAMTADCEDGLPRILMISHDWGGGTGKHIEELTALLQGRAHVFRLKYQSGRKVELVGRRQKHSLEFIVPRMAGEVAVAIRRLGIERVHVHHVVGIEGWIETLLKALGRPYDVTLHDAYFLTPNPMFRLDREVSSRSELDDAMAMAKGTPLNPLLPSDIDLSNWRERLSPILRFAERIIAPSEFIARLYRTVHPSLPIVVVPHHEVARAGLPLDASRLGAKDVLTIAVIGEPLAHKGLEMLEACALLARERSLPIRFVALGTGTDSLAAAGVRLTGAYNDRDLPYLLDLFAIDVLWLPYSAPESYSYALTAALASGLIVAMTDVGCFPERIVGFPQAIMLPVATDSDQWLETFEALKKKLVDGTAETRPLVLQRGDFYPDRYLEVAPSVPNALP